ncbi:hypothetical protein BDW22DRAFT_510605 [Trametopsis cervina]|nr:hypothetical protein BDW22DRAFT_510605 [Trametopsis cervina]
MSMQTVRFPDSRHVHHDAPDATRRLLYTSQRAESLLSGTAAEHLARPSSFSLKRQNQEQPTMPVRSSSPYVFERPPAAAGDLIRRFRPSNTQHSRLSTSSHLSRSHPLSSSPAPNDDDPHIHAHETNGQFLPYPSPLSGSVQTGHDRTNELLVVGNSIPLKSRKSLHQRLGGGADRAEAKDDTRTTGASGRRRVSHLEDPERIATPRSGSVTSSYGRAGQDEDISSIMMRGATDLRNVKHENDEQRREITFLQSQLQTAKEEKEEVLQRLKAVKASAKQGLESTSKSLDGVRVALDDLKAQSNEIFAFATQAKPALPDVQELRTTVQETVKALEPLFNENGSLYKVEETKALLNELQLESVKSHQVADLLRERLQSLGSDLVEAKTRISELEDLQSADRKSLRLSNSSLTDATSTIADLVSKLSTKQTELQNIVIEAREFEIRLENTQDEVSKLKATIATKDTHLEKMAGVQTQNTTLSTLLHEREARIAELGSVEERLDAAISLSNEHCSRIRVLEAQIVAKDDNAAELTDRNAESERKLQDQQSEIQRITQELHSARSREEAVGKELSRAIDEHESLKQQVQSINNTLDETKRELEGRVEAYHQANAKCQVLEDRIEGQLVSVRISKDAVESLQDRLTECEARYARDLEATTGKMSSQIAVLAEQKSVLDAKVTDLEVAMRVAHESGTALKAEYEDKLTRQEEAHRLQLELGQHRIEDAQRALEDTRSTIKSLEEQASVSRDDITALRNELREAKLPSPAHKEAIDALTSQTSALRQENTELVLRARSIDARYRTGDLACSQYGRLSSLTNQY